MRCHDHPALAPVFGELTPLGPLTREGLRRAVVEPALKQGYRFEDDALVEEMVDAVEGARAALPLLAFAVSRLWERRDREKKLLTREAYREIGGVEGALAQHAEATLERIGPEREGIVREIFRNLTTAQGTRAVLDREELLSALPDRAAGEQVLQQLVDARLLTSYETEGSDGEPAHHRVEIVHESLLSAWPRLVRWQTQDADGAQLRDQLRQAAHLWQERGTAPRTCCGRGRRTSTIGPGASATRAGSPRSRRTSRSPWRASRTARGADAGSAVAAIVAALAVGLGIVALSGAEARPRRSARRGEQAAGARAARAGELSHRGSRLRHEEPRDLRHHGGPAVRPARAAGGPDRHPDTRQRLCGWARNHNSRLQPERGMAGGRRLPESPASQSGRSRAHRPPR